ncbi:reverse transcriptase, RNA-dependent DNA polymerase, LTR copia-type gag-polypeptide [Tanacetum coccineum]
MAPSTSNSQNTHNSQTNNEEGDPNSPNNPLYLHQNDHPGLILISKKLTRSDNYGSWKRSMMIALNAKNTLKIVTGEYNEPEVNSRHRALGQILLMQPMPSVAKTYNMIRQEEKQREGYATQSTIQTALSAQSNYSRNNQYNSTRRNMNYSHGESSNKNYNKNERRSNFRKGIICGNCGKEGHNSEECYKIVGYPIGHPLHGKYKPPTQRNNVTRSVNLTQTSASAGTNQEGVFRSTSSNANG